MATEAAQLDLGLPGGPPAPLQPARRVAGFAGFSWAQILAGVLLLLVALWAMWTTREIVELRSHKVVSVRLGELVNEFALAEARSGDDPDKITARTRAFMQALDQALKARSQDGAIVLVGEAVIASKGEDITAAVAADVAKIVPMPVAQALPARQPVAPTPSRSGVSEMSWTATPVGGGRGDAAGSSAGLQAAGPPQGTNDPTLFSGGRNVP